MKQHDSLSTDFCEMSCLGFVIILVDIFGFWWGLQVDENNRHFTWRHLIRRDLGFIIKTVFSVRCVLRPKKNLIWT